MKKFISMLLSISLLVVACEGRVKPSFIDTNNQTVPINDEIQSQFTIPLHFQDAESFHSYLMSDEYTYIEKENAIFKFFDNISYYSRAELITSLANIGSNTEWDVDLISQFEMLMEDTIKNDPEILVEISATLDDIEINKFANFYYGNVIWNDEFPTELYYLQDRNPSAFNTFIDAFYNRYQIMSTRKLNQNFSKIDESSLVSIREQPNTNSNIVGTLNNSQKIIGLWKKDGWVFVYTGNEVGYVRLNELKPMNKVKHLSMSLLN